MYCVHRLVVDLVHIQPSLNVWRVYVLVLCIYVYKYIYVYIYMYICIYSHLCMYGLVEGVGLIIIVIHCIHGLIQDPAYRGSDTVLCVQ